MPVPTYTRELGEETLAPSVSVIYGKEIFDDTPSVPDDDISVETMNAQLKKSSGDSIEFLPASPMEDEPFEVFKKSFKKESK